MFLLLVNLLWATLVSARCHEPNVAHPLPDYDANDAVLQAAFARINTALTAAIAAPGFDSTSFSVEVTSSKESLWSQHHTARERNSSRPDIPQVNGDALYRIASITKSFTVLGILYQHAAGNLSLDDSIDTYIEEFRGEQEGSIPWKDITLRSLASQLSGIPRDFAQNDLLNRPFDFPFTPEDFGFPPVSRDGLPECDEYGDHYQPPCKLDDLISALKSKPPLFAPNQQSSYSNVAYELLGVALANVTNQTFESYIDDAIFKPLGMTKSTLSKPPDKAGVIPLWPQYWDIDEGIQNPTGGIYSSTIDLSKFLRYILTKYNGITPALNWANPVSPARGLHTFYGMPWEIFHTNKILRNSRRLVRFITKSGGLPGYTSIIMTVPEYDLGITILVAGPPKFFQTIQEVVTVEVVRAAEEVAIRQLQERYTGTFVSSNSGLNSSIVLEADHRGVVIKELISNGTDVFKTNLPYLAGAPEDRPWFIQVVPTLLYVDEEKQEGELWRMLITEERVDGETEIWDDFCPTNMDLAAYAYKPINEVIFWRGKGETFDTVEPTAFRVKLFRKGEDDMSEPGNRDQENLEL